ERGGDLSRPPHRDYHRRHRC
ncbi:MAG: hypothetical protein AVDCRST_MAG42-2922, partial [uncultured Chthoniobacterales bacterium]